MNTEQGIVLAAQMGFVLSGTYMACVVAITVKRAICRGWSLLLDQAADDYGARRRGW